jgi:hypothetical protein
MILGRKGDVQWTVMDGEAVILNLATGIYYTLDRVGTIIWQELAAGTGVEEIIEIVCERFDEEANVVRGDIEELLAHLKQEQLIVRE